jgi:UDP-2,3-diacylglucosamine pyrophosphatase LpxH
MLREREEIAQSIREDSYQRRIAEALDGALARAEEQVLDLTTSRYVIFSDLHRGTRDRADDFRRAERAYNAALARYFRMDYTLVVLGDAEELWEERPAPVLKTYEHSLALEAGFHKKGRYLRFWGNHDDLWQAEEEVARYLRSHFGDSPLEVRECLKFSVLDDDKGELGKLFVVHGHQGTDASDRWSGYARLPVRYLWRPFQRLTGYSLNTPAKDWMLREKHNIAMYTWAEKQMKLILIAGHTHRPVFESQTRSAQVRQELDAVEAQLAETPDDQKLRTQTADLAAELEWVRAQEEDQRPGREGGVEAATPMVKPCYFNTGCCCYADGDITGIELEGGKIRLVRWPNDEERPRPQTLAEASLSSVLDRC